MATKKQKAQIHILLAELALDRLAYEGLLAPYGVSSSADASFDQASADELIRTMRRMARETKSEKRGTGKGDDHGWGKQKFEYLRPRPSHLAEPKQLRKIEAMWRELARDPSDAALASFLERQTGGVRNIIWITKAHARAMICAEDAMKNFSS